MIRFPDLLNECRHNLEDKVNLTLPERDKLKSPLDRIMPTLYDSHEQIHKLETTLAEDRKFSTNEIISAQEIIQPSEFAVTEMIKASFTNTLYRIAGAKVADSGNKLDIILTKQIKILEREFKVEYQNIKKNNPLDIISASRNKLNKFTEEFFKLNEVYIQRNLPNKDIMPTLKIFQEYKRKSEEIQIIESQIKELKDKYQQTSIHDLLDYIKYASPLIKKGFFSDSKLIKQCKNTDYYEGLSELDSLRFDFDYFSDNERLFLSINERVLNIEELIKSSQTDFIKYSENNKTRSILDKSYNKLEDLTGKIDNVDLKDKYQRVIIKLKSEINSLNLKSDRIKKDKEDTLRRNKQLKENSQIIYQDYIQRIEQMYFALDELIPLQQPSSEKLRLTLLQASEYISTAEMTTNEIRKKVDFLGIKDKDKYLKFIDRQLVLIESSKEKNERINEQINQVLAGYQHKISQLRNDISLAEQEIKRCWVNEEWELLNNNYETRFSAFISNLEGLRNESPLNKYEKETTDILKQSNKIKRDSIDYLDEISIEKSIDTISPKSKVDSTKYKRKERDVYGDQSFSLSMYIENIGHPHNTQYFTIWNILTGKHGERDWESRFKSFTRELDKGVNITTRQDKQYLTLIQQGIQKIIESPPTRFDMQLAEKAYESLHTRIESAKV
jgi:hypothetical protein